MELEEIHLPDEERRAANLPKLRLSITMRAGNRIVTDR
jgi:hypothetical protein